jgi:hypothetical protein
MILDLGLRLIEFGSRVQHLGIRFLNHDSGLSV